MSAAVGLTQLDQVSRRVADECVAPAPAVDHAIDGVDPGLRQRRQSGVDVFDA